MNRPSNWHQFAAAPAEVEKVELLDLRSLYRILRCRVHILLLCVLAGVGVALIYLILAVPVYTATTELYIDTRDKKAIDLGEVLPGLGSDNAAIDSEVEIIRSSSVARRVIAKLPAERRAESDSEVSWLASLESALSRLGLTGGNAPADGVPQSVEQVDDEVRKFAKGLDVKRVGLTYVIAVSYTSHDPGMAATYANLVAQTYLLHQLDAKFDATKRASDWLQERLRTLSDKVHESEMAAEAYRAEHNLIGVEQQTPYDAQLRKLNEELAIARVQMDERLAKLQQAREVIRARQELTSIDVVAHSDVVKNLREALAMVAREEAELTTRFTDKHPKVLNKRAERQDLKKRIAEEAERIVLNLENEYKIASLRQASIEASLQDLKNKTKGARSSLIRMRELELEAEASKAVYKAFLNRFKETSQQETLRTADSRIITEAVPPRTKSSPKALMTLLLALFGSSTLGFGMVLLLNHLDDRVKTGEQLESRLSIPYLTSLPKLSSRELRKQAEANSVGWSGGAEPVSAYTEAIRTLNICLQQPHRGAAAKTVLITSSRPNEGKSTLAENLSKYAAKVGLRTLLIDADLRSPSLSLRMGDPSSRGLVDILSGKRGAKESIVQHPSGVDFLTGSAIPARAAEMLCSHQMDGLLNWARDAYDLVVIDAAPVLHIVDARVLARLVDGVIFVIEWDYTPIRIVENAIKNLEIPRDRIIGGVLNKVDLPRLAVYKGENYEKYIRAYPHYYGVLSRKT
jgi:succinoglycan biosynthesis transport protein ExoP